MEIHGSVVTHLLSQVKIGMDLTKVVLPTFILERRSLLEMYADYFAHPDQFVKYAFSETFCSVDDTSFRCCFQNSRFADASRADGAGHQVVFELVSRRTQVGCREETLQSHIGRGVSMPLAGEQLRTERLARQRRSRSVVRARTSDFCRRTSVSSSTE
jgi:hypothetical protein